MSKVTKLRELHASIKSFTFEMQKYHWTIKGKGFYTLHKAFEELYDWGFEQEDEIAERLLIIGEQPVLSLQQIIELNKISVLAESDLVENKMIDNLRDAFATLLAVARQALEQCEDEDVGTDALLSDFIADVEKRAWMLRAYLA
ncbi:Dps family protein [Volucribacter amazonae]|uniref:Ferritin/DPS domain-containing protein n=1 Tax=Volucribacter amazonae TaxID=256731 RepID=A0A9X4PAN6_9PAST|nr:DNA starvation/stationary phase protection protein [Volucribacter amazonae]MDG6895578.1 hypothetical protein [Volucribacter amazonae]